MTIYSSMESNKGYAVNLTFKPENDTKKMLEDFYQNGVAINSLQHMHMQFIDAGKINNWLEFYHGTTQQNELAVAFMHAKFLDLEIEGGSDYKRFTRLYKNFINRIHIAFSRRDESLYPESNRNIVLNMIKEFDEAGHIGLPDYIYLEKMKK